MLHNLTQSARSLFGAAGIRALLATATLAALPCAALASHNDWDHDRGHGHDGSARVDVRIGDACDRAPVAVERRVWIEPVYRVVDDRQWVAPVYRTVTVRVWKEESTQTITERVWVPDRVGYRDVEYHDRWGRRNQREYTLLEAAHYEDQPRQVCVAAHYEDVLRQELVCDGHWEIVQRQDLVSPGHWEAERVVTAPRPSESHARIELRIPF